MAVLLLISFILGFLGGPIISSQAGRWCSFFSNELTGDGCSPTIEWFFHGFILGLFVFITYGVLAGSSKQVIAEHWRDLSHKFYELTKNIIAVSMESTYLVLWIALQYGFNSIVHSFSVSTNIDRGIFLLLQVVFAISTIAPIALSIYKEVRVMVIRSNKAIKKAERE